MILIASKKIKKVHARWILDSRGNPTVEVDVHTDTKIGRAAVPQGASVGRYEAISLVDDSKAFNGHGVSHAINHVNKTLHTKLKGLDVTKQEDIDNLMVTIDGTDDKSRIGANAILGTSMAAARCGASVMKKPLYSYLGAKKVLPIPFSNFLNGGKHAGSEMKIQEFMLIPTKAKSFSQATQMLSETYMDLKKILVNRYGKSSINIGDEGGFVPPIRRVNEALKLLMKAMEEAGYDKKMKIGIDAAASEFYNWKQQNYAIEGKNLLSREELIDYYMDLIKAYPIVSIEDPFDQDDFESWKVLTKKSKIQIVGDDLTATNVDRVQEAVGQGLCNTLLLKLNQIGTLTEAFDAADLAKKNGWRIMASHRSGETNDNFISDLAVGMGYGEIKLGAPCRGERVSKFNRLLRIEEELKSKGKYMEF